MIYLVHIDNKVVQPSDAQAAIRLWKVLVETGFSPRVWLEAINERESRGPVSQGMGEEGPGA